MKGLRVKVILSAFGGRIKGLFDTPRLQPDIYFMIEPDLSYISPDSIPADVTVIEFKKARFSHISKKENHFQYGELPIYELREIE